MRIIRAILEGGRDREKLALMRAPGVKSTPEEIAKALKGDIGKNTSSSSSRQSGSTTFTSVRGSL